MPLAQWAIQALGWRPALWELCALALVALPAALCLKRESGASAGALTLGGASLSSACRHRAYVLVAIGFAACGVQLIFIGTHLPSYLVECGLSAADGAWALDLVGLFNVIGRVALVRLVSRHDPLPLLAAVYALRTAATVIFVSLPPSSLSSAVFAAAMGSVVVGCRASYEAVPGCALRRGTPVGAIRVDVPQPPDRQLIWRLGWRGLAWPDRELSRSLVRLRAHRADGCCADAGGAYLVSRSRLEAAREIAPTMMHPLPLTYRERNRSNPYPTGIANHFETKKMYF